MAAAYKDRTAGSIDDARLADFVEQTLQGPRRARRARGVHGPAHGDPPSTGDLITVTGTRPGLSERPDRRARPPRRPGLANLSGTAALLELARVIKGRELRKTLVLVSTSGSTTGFAGARAWARENRAARSTA